MSEPDRPQAVFVYGTLQPGQARWGLVEPFVGDPPRRAAVPGQLFDTGLGYPAARFDAVDGSEIRGSIIPLAPRLVARALTVLDHVEGTAHGLYERVVVETTDGERVWSYAWAGDIEILTPIEAWSP